MIFIIGEIWNREDEAAGQSFSGAAGRLLKKSLSAVGIRFEDCYATSVFNLRPEPQDVKSLCGPRDSAIPGLPALATGKYVQQEYGPELSRLYDELSRLKPTLILALGSTACWALRLGTSVNKIRGAATPSLWGKVFPTINPGAVFRDHSLRPVLFADLQKVAAEATFSEIRRPQREIWVEPSLDDLTLFYDTYIRDSKELSIDIETAGNYITCVGFAPTPKVALVVPFSLSNGLSYWPTLREEVAGYLNLFYIKKIVKIIS